MKTNYAPIILGCFLLSACTSSTRSNLNSPIKANNQTSPVVEQAMDKSIKRVVAIGRFSDETKRGNSFLVDNNDNRLGKQASDILSSRLTDSGKFIMVERGDLNLLEKESQTTNEKLSVLGANFIILGSVSEYGRSTTSEVGVFSRNKIQKASVTVNVRLVNTKTSEVVYSEEATGEAVAEANHVFGVGKRAAYDSSLDDKALSAAISKVVSNIMENLLDSPWQAFLLSDEGGQYFMTGGEEQGIKLSDTFKVLTQGKQVKNPQTGKLITLPGQKVATIKVIGFVGKGESALSITTIETGKLESKKLSQYVVREL